MSTKVVRVSLALIIMACGVLLTLFALPFITYDRDHGPVGYPAIVWRVSFIMTIAAAAAGAAAVTATLLCRLASFLTFRRRLRRMSPVDAREALRLLEDSTDRETRAIVKPLLKRFSSGPSEVVPASSAGGSGAEVMPATGDPA